jgi:hypothetical protein
VPVADVLSRHEQLSKANYCHEILARGADIAACKGKVLKFFENYPLVRYSDIEVKETESISALDPRFKRRLSNAIRKNHRILRDMIRELQREDVSTLDDLEKLPQGYKSKLLHTISHFLDGFLGIDTYFFNLEEDSHWVSDELRKSIKAAPSSYRLFSVKAEP